MTTQQQTLEGFSRAGGQAKHRLICVGQGLDGSGKTHFSLTAPAPIGFLNTDIGLEGVVERFATKKPIYVSNYIKEHLAIRNEIDPDMPSPEVRKLYTPLWEHINADYHTTIHSPMIKTVVIDSFTTLWEIVRYAMLGRTNLPLESAYKYGPVNEKFVEMIQQAYTQDKNLILLHRMKPEYIDDKFTGNYVLDGCRRSPYEIQVRVEFYNQDSTYGLRVLKCRQNGLIVGMELEDEACSFPSLASSVFPEADTKAWE